MVLVLQVSLVTVATIEALAAHMAGKVEVAFAQLAMTEHGLLVFECSAATPAPIGQNEGRCDEVTMAVTVWKIKQKHSLTALGWRTKREWNSRQNRQIRSWVLSLVERKLSVVKCDIHWYFEHCKVQRSMLAVAFRDCPCSRLFHPLPNQPGANCYLQCTFSAWAIVHVYLYM